jgi:hypothetical protein
MIEAREVIYGIYGAYRLCRLDPQGLSYFNATPEGFWRSFFSAVLIAPVHFLITFLDINQATIQAPFPRVILIEGLAYLILVFAYPLAMYYISQLLDRQRQYITYIVAYNWAGVIIALIELPASALGASELVPASAANVVEIAATVVTLVMLWYIARTTLQITRLAAAGLVIVDVLISVIVSSIAEGRLAVA